MFRLLALCGCLAVSACAATPPLPPPGFLAAPANSDHRVAPVRVVDAAAGTRSFAVVGPRDWRDVNSDITPKTSEGPR